MNAAEMTIDEIFDMYAEVLMKGFVPDCIMTSAPEACRMYKTSLSGILDADELEKIEVTLVLSDQPDRMNFHIDGPPDLVQKVLANTIQPCPFFITQVKE